MLVILLLNLLCSAIGGALAAVLAIMAFRAGAARRWRDSPRLSGWCTALLALGVLAVAFWALGSSPIVVMLGLHSASPSGLAAVWVGAWLTGGVIVAASPFAAVGLLIYLLAARVRRWPSEPKPGGSHSSR